MRKTLRRLALGARYLRAETPLGRRLRDLTPGERRAEAKAFLRQYFAETGGGEMAFRTRWAEVRRALRRHGHYDLTPDELGFGARIAWRNHGRCIGRLTWNALDVVDCRQVTTVAGLTERLEAHMREALGDGRITPVISIFPPAKDGRAPLQIESAQLTQYAGYAAEDGTVLGDRQNSEATRIARTLGWLPPEVPGRFDVLPVIVRDGDDARALIQLPPETQRHVPIAHPDHASLAALGLRWYAVPYISNMILTIGGIDFPCAPFNGYYMCTEIASRDFADRTRYDLLPEIARAFGLTPDDRADPLWRDTTLTELNRAVLASFNAAGVTMIDHHEASTQFMRFHGREQAAGRHVAADWRWIVPPQAGAGCEVFHLKMRNFHPVPNFYTARDGDGMRLMPYYGDHDRSRASAWADRILRRLRLWRRMAW